MREPSILFIKPGTMKDHQKAKLTKAGVICVEVNDPANVQFVRPSTALPVEELSHGEILAAAARAITNNAFSQHSLQAFGKYLALAIISRHPPGGHSHEG